MRSRAVLTLALAFGLLASPLAAEAQPTAKISRIGVLVPGKPPARGVDAFRRGLRDLRYIDGQNIVLELRWDEDKPEQTPRQAAELVRASADVIVAGTTTSAQAAKNATGTIPIVMAAGPYALEVGLIESLARPGGNVTGVSLFTRELTAKRLELLKEAVPGASRVAYLWTHGRRPVGATINPVVAAMNGDYEAAARSLGVELRPIEVRGSEDFESAFQTAARGRVGGVILAQGPLWAGHRARLAGLALKHRLPMISGETGAAQAGTLLYYGSDIPEGWQRAAAYVDKILKGARPADLPVEQPTSFELVVNLKTAKALGLTFPPSILVRADQVIE
jgi:putative ABC transport system substrate-binding protein